MVEVVESQEAQQVLSSHNVQLFFSEHNAEEQVEKEEIVEELDGTPQEGSSQLSEYANEFFMQTHGDRVCSFELAYQPQTQESVVINETETGQVEEKLKALTLSIIENVHKNLDFTAISSNAAVIARVASNEEAREKAHNLNK